MYHKIRSRKSVPALYEDKLIVCSRNHQFLTLTSVLKYLICQAESVLTAEDANAARKLYKSHLESQLKAVETFSPKVDMLAGKWSNMVWPGGTEGLNGKNPETGVDIASLREIGLASVRLPVDFVRITAV